MRQCVHVFAITRQRCRACNGLTGHCPDYTPNPDPRTERQTRDEARGQYPAVLALQADGDMLRMRVTVENTSPARAVEAFEIYMYATDAWGDPLYGEDYVYYETTEKLVEPFETAMSEYVTMPRASDIARVYAGIHRVKYDNGEVVEADPINYAWWDIE